MTIQMIIDLVANEGVEENHCLRDSHKRVLDSSISHSSRIPHRIGTMMHKLVEPTRIRMHIGSGLVKIIQEDMMQQ